MTTHARGSLTPEPSRTLFVRRVRRPVVSALGSFFAPSRSFPRSLNSPRRLAGSPAEAGSTASACTSTLVHVSFMVICDVIRTGRSCGCMPSASKHFSHSWCTRLRVSDVGEVQVHLEQVPGVRPRLLENLDHVLEHHHRLLGDARELRPEPGEVHHPAEGDDRGVLHLFLQIVNLNGRMDALGSKGWPERACTTAERAAMCASALCSLSMRLCTRSVDTMFADTMFSRAPALSFTAAATAQFSEPHPREARRAPAPPPPRPSR